MWVTTGCGGGGAPSPGPSSAAPTRGTVQAPAQPGGDGWAVVSRTVYRTSDGGARWTRSGSFSATVAGLYPASTGHALWALVHPAPSAPCGGHVCAAGVAVVGPSSTAAQGTGPYVFHALAAVTSTHAWAIASGGGPGYRILHTTDAGRSWKTTYRSGTSYAPESLWGF